MRAVLIVSALFFGTSVLADSRTDLLDQIARVSEVSEFPEDFHSASLNWAGYAATDAEYTGVEGTWVVPEIKPKGVHSAYATWVGIGGIEGEDLIQSGTAAIENRVGDVDYFSWFELLPDAAIPLPVDIAPGDTVSVRITEEWPTYWSIEFENVTTGEDITIPARYNSSRSSAEWIQERPVIGGDELIELSHFETVEFQKGFAIQDGRRVSIEESGASRISMKDFYGETLAVPSDLQPTGEGFAVARHTPVVEAVPLFSGHAHPRGYVIVLTVMGYSVAIPLMFEA